MFSEKVLETVKNERKTIDFPRNKREFIENLVFCYQFMVASHNLTVLAAKQATGDLKRYFEHHATEEIGHDEWLKADLASESVFVESFAVNPCAEAMAGVQYYNIFHLHPVSLLGYMAFLEMSPPSLAEVEVLEARYGEGLLKTLKYHAIHDVDHAKDLCEMLDAIDEKLHPIVLDSIKTTADYFRFAMKKTEVRYA